MINTNALIGRASFIVYNLLGIQPRFSQILSMFTVLIAMSSTREIEYALIDLASFTVYDLIGIQPRFSQILSMFMVLIAMSSTRQREKV